MATAPRTGVGNWLYDLLDEENPSHPMNPSNLARDRERQSRVQLIQENEAAANSASADAAIADALGSLWGSFSPSKPRAAAPEWMPDLSFDPGQQGQGMRAVPGAQPTNPAAMQPAAVQPPPSPAPAPPSRTEPLKNKMGSRGGARLGETPAGMPPPPPAMQGFSWGGGVKLNPQTGRPVDPGTFHLDAPNFTGGEVHTTAPSATVARGTGGEVSSTYHEPRVAGSDHVARTDVGGGGFGAFETPESELEGLLQRRDSTAARRDLERLAVNGKPAPETAGEMLQTERARRPLVDAMNRYNDGVQALSKERAIADAALKAGKDAAGRPYTAEDHAADLQQFEEDGARLTQQYAVEAHGDPRLFKPY